MQMKLVIWLKSDTSWWYLPSLTYSLLQFPKHLHLLYSAHHFLHAHHMPSQFPALCQSPGHAPSCTPVPISLTEPHLYLFPYQTSIYCMSATLPLPSVWSSGLSCFHYCLLSVAWNKAANTQNKSSKGAAKQGVIRNKEDQQIVSRL